MNQLEQVIAIDNVRLSDDENAVIIIDQSQLPGRIEYLSLTTVQACYDAIYTLKVRGAPAIGIFAGYSIYILAKQIKAACYDDFFNQFLAVKTYLNSARPTAVNLSWALNRMERAVCRNAALPIPALLSVLHVECTAIHQEDIEMCKKISAYGLSLLKDGNGILTHCNAGPLATSKYGTGLGPLFLGKEKGYSFKVFADETRPLLQGARLTAFELEKAGIDVTLICDNMASMVMKNGWIDACLVGCDRVAMNGDTANKIGTSGVAVLAKYYGIPFYVLGPTSTIDKACPNGTSITIEERPGEEIKSMFFTQSTALPETKCYNPAFDVTDHTLITAIITEKGICYPPYTDSIPKLFQKKEPVL